MSVSFIVVLLSTLRTLMLSALQLPQIMQLNHLQVNLQNMETHTLLTLQQQDKVQESLVRMRIKITLQIPQTIWLAWFQNGTMIFMELIGLIYIRIALISSNHQSILLILKVCMERHIM